MPWKLPASSSDTLPMRISAAPSKVISRRAPGSAAPAVKLNSCTRQLSERAASPVNSGSPPEPPVRATFRDRAVPLAATRRRYWRSPSRGIPS